jgi:hypothetical protein
MDQSLDFGTWGAAIEPHREELRSSAEHKKRISRLMYLANLLLKVDGSHDFDFYSLLEIYHGLQVNGSERVTLKGDRS